MPRNPDQDQNRPDTQSQDQGQSQSNVSQKQKQDRDKSGMNRSSDSDESSPQGTERIPGIDERIGGDGTPREDDEEIARKMSESSEAKGNKDR